MNPFSLGLIVAVFSTFGLGIWVLSLRINKTHLFFSAYLFSIGFWAFFSAIQTLSSDYGLVKTAVFIMHIGAILIPVFFINFLYFLTDAISRKSLLIWYLGAIFFLAINFTPLFVSGVSPKHPFPFFMVAGPLYPLYILFFIIAWSFSVLHLYVQAKRSVGTQKKQLYLLFVGSLVGYVGGSGAFLPVYDLSLPILYPFGNFAITIYVSIMTYAIVRHHLLDIYIIVKRTIVFSGLLIMVFSVVAFVAVVSQILAGYFYSVPPFVANAISACVAMALYNPTVVFMTHVTDRFLYQKKGDYKVIFEKLAQEVIRILDVEPIALAVIDVMKNSIRIEAGAVFVLEEEAKKYVRIETFGDLGEQPEFYERNSPFAEYLKKAGGVVLNDPQAKAFREVCPNRQVCAVVPLILQGKLIGFLMMGKKKSDQAYDAAEISFLTAIAAQVAIALSNAHEIALRKKNQAEYFQQAKLASIGTIASGMAHELKNPLQIIRGCLGLIESGFKKGYYSGMRFEDIQAEALEVIEKTFDGVDRANKIVARLNRISKKQTQQKIELLDIRKPIAEVVEMVTHDFEMKGVLIKVKAEEDIPLIGADYDLLMQIFLNFLTNARDAILMNPTDTGKQITVSIAADPSNVTVSVKDTGVGIKPADLPHLFNPFFTTKDVTRNDDPNAVTGTGLGLHLVRQMVAELNGQIQVESAHLQGAVFHVSFPVGAKAVL